MAKIVHPTYYQIFQRQGSRWFVFESGRNSHAVNSQPRTLEAAEPSGDLSEDEIMVELFRLNGGLPGYYLANLRDRQYYYCGASLEDIKTTLHDLEIGSEECEGAS